jgi:hypothetical protein
VEGADEAGEWDGQLRRLPAGAGVVPVEPPVDPPAVGVAGAWLALHDWRGNGDRELRGEEGQPPALLVDVVDGPRDPREAYDQVLAEAEQRVVGTGGGDAFQR